MNDLNTIVGLVEGALTASDSFNSLSVYMNPADRGKERMPAEAVPGLETQPSAVIVWQE